AAIKALAIKHKYTLTIGRSHGIHAEPVSFGFKMLGHYAAFRRGQQRLTAATDEIATCKLRGPVGTFSSVDPSVEQYVAEKIGLRVEDHATQVIPRDRHAMFFATLAVMAGSIENLAPEIRHLQRTEVNEAQEFFDQGQKGSSAMPHKQNPILSENLTGIARLIRGYVMPALENITLWHERDISHSSVERVAAPDACILLDFALDRLATMMEKLVVKQDQLTTNMALSFGIYHSGRVLNTLTQKGMSREAAYSTVQTVAQRAAAAKRPFASVAAEDKTITAHLSPDTIAQLCDDQFYLRHMDAIFAQVLE
ncbi:MAG: lyase family protein, partial [Alphaproteobacteria bacterium]|nr:lyase family protein [Alphaproteobacteria bacterium]